MTRKPVYDSGPITYSVRGLASSGSAPPSYADEAPGSEATPEARGPMPVLVGCPRSGTTLLTVMLDSHPQLAIPPETAFLPELRTLAGKEGSELRRAFFILLTTDRWGVSNWNDIGIDRDAFWRRLCTLRDFSITGGLRLFYGMYADRLGKRRFGEKTPADVHCMPQIEAFLPEARFIHIIRDPRDVVLSLRRTNVGRTIKQAARIWVDMVSAARASASRVSRYHEVRYEALVLKPAVELARICDFLELEYTDALLDYRASGARHIGRLGDRPMSDGRATVPRQLRARLHENLVQPLREDRVHGWRQTMSAEDCAKVEKIAGPLMLEIGYALRGG